ncbi:MAG: tetratricopeptide repeat protein [Anaerolineae bacterium]|nr:tetratricopeptide repeat protein [Anaerolineae bacterium]
MISLVVGVSAAQAQEISPTLDIVNNVVTTLILVVIVIALLVVVGGLVMFLRLRQMDRLIREQRTKLAEMHAAYRELQNARKRTDSALSAISGKSADAPASAEPNATAKASLSRLAQASALLPVGERLYRAQDYGGALTNYLRASELDDDSPLIHYRVGYTQIQVNQLDRAMTHLNAALEIDGHFLPARAALGYLYRRLSEAPNMDEAARAQMLEEAEHHLSNAMMRAPRMLDEDDEAWMTSLAGIYRRRREYDRALAVYADASNITPFSSYPYAGVALVYADKNDYAQMFRNYERVEWRARKEIGARPTNPWGHINLLLARVALGRDDKLIEEEFTLTFLSLPKDAAFILPTLVSSMKRLEWALADAKQPARAERAAFLVRRIEHLESSNEPHSTQVMNHMADDRKRRTTSALRAIDNGKRRPPSEELPTTRELTDRTSEWPDID